MLEDAQFMEKSEELLAIVPLDGSAIGNVTLKQALGWDEEYWNIRNHLIDLGRLEKGRGKGGSVRRTSLSMELQISESEMSDSYAESSDSVVPPRIQEAELYESMFKVINEYWAKDAGFDQYIVEIIARQGRRKTGGKWTRPDIVVAATTTYPFVPGKFFDVVTFEVKPFDTIDITAVYEAVAHYRAAHRSYVLIHIPEEKMSDSGIQSDLDEMCEEAKRQGVGVIVASDPADGSTWDERIESIRHEPEPKRLNDFLARQAGSEMKDKAIRWFR